MSTRKQRSRQGRSAHTPRVPAEPHANGKQDTNGDAEPTRREWISTTAHKVRIPPAVELWESRLVKGQVTLMVGDTSTGKTTYGVRIAAHCTHGEALPGGPHVEACTVAVFCKEQGGVGMWKDRLKRAGADLRRILFPGWNDAGERKQDLSLPSDWEDLAAYLIANKVGLYILDPVHSFLDQGLEENTSHCARGIVQAMTDAARLSNACALGLKNPNKRAAGSVLDRVSGHKDWVNACTFVLGVALDPNDDDIRILASLKPRPPGAPPSLAADLDVVNKVPRLMWRGQTALRADDVFNAEADPIERGQLAIAKACARAMMDKEDIWSKDIFQAADDRKVSPRTMVRALGEIGAETYQKWVDGKPRHYYKKPPGGWRK